MSKYPAPQPSALITVDVVIFTVRNNALSVLLIRREWEPFTGEFSLPGGFLLAGERALDTAKRVLHDKAGVSDVYTEQLYTFDDLNRDPRGRTISMVYFALVPESRLIIQGSGLQEPQLLDVALLPKLAFDHADMITYAVQRLRSKLEYTNVVYSLLPAKFTMSELQHTYEAILGTELDKRNFQKKFASLKLIEPTTEMTSGGKHRPARLYSFIEPSPSELKRFF